MPGKRKETMDIREILMQLQQGQSNRAVERNTGIHRKTVARYRAWAKEQGLLEGPLPSLTVMVKVWLLLRLTVPLSVSVMSSVKLVVVS